MLHIAFGNNYCSKMIFDMLIDQVAIREYCHVFVNDGLHTFVVLCSPYKNLVQCIETIQRTNCDFLHRFIILLYCDFISCSRLIANDVYSLVSQ